MESRSISMKKLIALGLSTATLLALPTTADARDWGRGGNWDRQNYSYRDRDGDRNGDRYRDRYRRYSGYGYRNYGYAYPRTRTVISIGYPGYYGGYGGYGGARRAGAACRLLGPRRRARL